VYSFKHEIKRSVKNLVEIDVYVEVFYIFLFSGISASCLVALTLDRFFAKFQKNREARRQKKQAEKKTKIEQALETLKGLTPKEQLNLMATIIVTEKNKETQKEQEDDKDKKKQKKTKAPEASEEKVLVSVPE